MTGIYHTLGIGAESLHTSRQGVDTAGHNIANAHTEGFSRQRLDVRQRIPSVSRGVVIGNGVFVKNITRAHDSFLEKEINQVNQKMGYTNTKFTELKKLEGIFSPELNASVADEVSKFFASLQDLSNFPEELIVRTNVKEAAINLIHSFKRIDDHLRTAQNGINSQIEGEAEEINVILEHIAKLNIAINNLEIGGEREANDLKDQQDRLLRQLTEKIEINYYRSDGNMVTVRGPKETLLVDRSQNAKMVLVPKDAKKHHFELAVQESPNSLLRTITKANTSGNLKALVEVRDEKIESLLANNNLMARTFADHVNAIHSRGYGVRDFSNTKGRDFFYVPDDIDFAAREMKLSDIIAETTDAISAASSPNAPGDNIIVNDLLRLQNMQIMDGNRATFNEFYANYVGVFGLEIVKADHDKQAEQILIADLNSRREAISGVSLDEEAMRLLRWQANFTASSRVITTCDEMLETILGMKR